MAIFERSDPDAPVRIDDWADGVGWIAHPAETGRRASHAVRGEEGVWVIDPVDAPGVDDLVADLGPVTGVVVLSNWHARDAGRVAARHGVAVHCPVWMDRVGERVEAPVERFRRGFGGFAVRRCEPIPWWREGIAYRECDRTLVVPESLGTAPLYRVGAERIGVTPMRRLAPLRPYFGGLEPERILVGHGQGIFEDAGGALDHALAGAHRRFPRALVEHGLVQVRGLVEAVVGG